MPGGRGQGVGAGRGFRSAPPDRVGGAGAGPAWRPVSLILPMRSGGFGLQDRGHGPTGVDAGRDRGEHGDGGEGAAAEASRADGSQTMTGWDAVAAAWDAVGQTYPLGRCSSRSASSPGGRESRFLAWKAAALPGAGRHSG